jgi:hypothetical protein
MVMKISGSATVIPAYGRDYKDSDAARDAFLAGKDFKLSDSRHVSQYCSIRDFQPGTKVWVRYNRYTSVIVVTVPKKPEKQDREYPIPRPPIPAKRPVDHIMVEMYELKQQGKCPVCHKPVEGFTTELKAREYSISGYCEPCQDDMFQSDL